MKKTAQFIIVFILFVMEVFLLKLIFEFYGLYQSKQIAIETIRIEEENAVKEAAEEIADEAAEKVPPVYNLYEDGAFAGEFSTFEEAKAAAGAEKGIEITENETEVYDDRNNFLVYRSGELLAEFTGYPDALWYAKKHINAKIILRSSDNLKELSPRNSSEIPLETEIWNYGYTPPKSRNLSADVIMQLPELARGCEVTSLAMLLEFMGIAADKTVLAEQVTKNADYFGWKGGKKYSGDPNEGFIGDIYSFDNDGLGVYHKPVYALAKTYTDKAVDLTGCEFRDLYAFIGKGRPVWVIINGEYNTLPESEFETWYKKDGTKMKITYREHSVLLTGYDEEFVYFNDPLVGKAQAPAAEFQAGWEQMGAQAITVVE